MKSGLFKKISAFLLTLIIILPVALPAFSSDADATVYINQDLSELFAAELQNFIGNEESNNYDRTFGTEGEAEAAEYIADRLQAFGYNLGIENRGVEKFTFNYNKAACNSQNVIAFYDCGREGAPTVIIGAHYDNTYGVALNQFDGITKSHGVYDNGVSVAALLTIAYYFNRLNYEKPVCNIEFVFFGSEEPGCYGSRAYLASLSQAERDNVLVMLNLDSISGQNLYMYSDEVKTAYNDFYYSIAEKYGYDFKKIPSLKKTFLYGGTFRNLLYNFPPQNSDNSTFANAGFKTVSFFSGNLKTFSKVGFVESDVYPAVSHTSSDNMETFMAYYGDTYKKNAEAVYMTIIRSLYSDSLIDTVQNASVPGYGFFTSSVTGYVSLFVLFSLAVFAVYIFYGKIKAEAIEKLKSRIPPVGPSGGAASVFGEEYEDAASGNNREDKEDKSVFGDEYENKD